MSTIQLFLLLSLSLSLQYLEDKRIDESFDRAVILDNDKSNIQIIGTTNVSEFACIYEAKLISDTLEVKLEPLIKMTVISGASFQLPIKNFKCESSQMTQDFQALLRTKEFPEIKIKILGFYDEASKHYIKAAINLAGVENEFDFVTELAKNNDVFYCEGKPEVCISDFGLIAPEKFFGLVKVNENIMVKFNLTFRVINV